MFGILLAVLSGLAYGSSDFTGAVASKETDSSIITVAMQVVSLVCVVGYLVVVGEPVPPSKDFAWAALGGLGVAVGLVALYRALSTGPMSVAASLTALVGASIPIVVGLLLGARPSLLATIGIVLSVPAVVLVSVGSFGTRTSNLALPRHQYRQQALTATTRGLAIVSGAGFGLFFVALSFVSSEAGLFPLVGTRLACILALGGAVTMTNSWEPIGRKWWPLVVVTGIFDFAANGLYLTALGHRDLTIVAPIVSLYPVATVLLAWIILHERISRTQVLGLVLSGTAMMLISQ